MEGEDGGAAAAFVFFDDHRLLSTARVGISTIGPPAGAFNGATLAELFAGMWPLIRGTRSRWAVVDGLRMHARVPADPAPEDAPAVVLVHGLVVSSRYMIPTLLRLAADHRVYAPDLPGFGRSEKPLRALDIPGLARALDGWMEAVGLESAVLVGNSMGCQVIAELYASRPERVGRVVLQGPTMEPGARTLLRQAARLALDCFREPPAMILIEGFDLLAAGPLRSLRTFRHAADYRIEEKLPGLRAPALVVHGERDPIVPEHWAREAAGLLPNGRLVVVREAAHALNYNSPSELARCVRAFIRTRVSP